MAYEARAEASIGTVQTMGLVFDERPRDVVNGEEIGALQGQDTPLKTGDEISIIPALAGGA